MKIQKLVVIAFVIQISIFAAAVVAQIPQIVRPPRITQVAAPTPTPVSPVKLNPASNISKIKSLPDLRIAELKFNKTKCSLYFRVINEGFKDAGRFELWIQAKGFTAGVAETSGLANGSDLWVSFSMRPPKYSTSNLGSSCLFYASTQIRVAVDPRYLYVKNPIITAYVPPRTIGDLLRPGAAVPAGNEVQESLIDETNENNNELTINRAEIKIEP